MNSALSFGLLRFNALLRFASQTGIIVLTFLIAVVASSFGEVVTLRHAQLDGTGPPGSGVYNNRYPISVDDVTIAIKINKIKKWKPGSYNLYRVLSPGDEQIVWGFDIDAEGRFYAAISIYNEAEDSASYNFHYATASGATSSSTLNYVFRRVPYVGDSSSFVCQNSWTIKNVRVYDHYEFWSGIPMTNSYVWPASTTIVWTIENDYPDPDCDSPSSCNPGMAGYTLDTARASFNISDTPVTYNAPRGPRSFASAFLSASARPVSFSAL